MRIAAIFFITTLFIASCASSNKAATDANNSPSGNNMAPGSPSNVNNSDKANDPPPARSNGGLKELKPVR